MSEKGYLKNGNEWCEVDPIQPSHGEIQDELRKRLGDKFRPSPFHRGLRRTKCGALLGGPPHPRPIDACPTCVDCAEADV